MKYDLIARAAQLLRRGGRHRRWRRAVSGLAAVVVFVTSYMLILPALTLEQDTICGLEEHTHADACCEQRLVCTLEESEPVYEDQQVLTCTLPEGEGHAHTEACYGLTCALEESAGHTHTEACCTAVSELTCTLAESEGHAHGEGCYGEDGSLICTLEESAGHTHADGCYTTVSQLTCTQAESAGHTHADGCYGLICGQEECAGHTHTDACCTTEQVQVSGHVHTEACYEQALICQLPEHTHDESCYPAQEEELVCELSQHTHGEGCYDADGNLTCTLPEHTHGEECYALVEIPEEDVPMTAFPEVIPEGYEKYSFDDGSGLVVTAYAPEGAFGQDVQLFAEVLSEDSEEYAQAKENLDKAENAPEYTGMAAMDIRFVDAAAEDPAAAEEIEPDAALGRVYVDIQAQALIPEDVDESTLAVQHHVETESDKIFGLIPNVFDPTVTTVETVADSSDATGTVTAAPAAVQTLDLTEEDSAPAAQDVEAQFAVDSFSTFTITWENKDAGYNTSLTVYRINEEGTGIGDEFVVEAFGSNAITLNNIEHDVSGYTYQKAVVASSPADALNDNADVIYRVRLNYSSSYGSVSAQWQYNTNESGNRDWTNLSDEQVYLIYSTTNDLYIDDSEMLSDGQLKAVYTGEGYTGEFTYVWERKDEDSDTWQKVERMAVTEVGGVNQYNVAENGSWLNVTLDEGARATYRVSLVSADGEKLTSEIVSPDYKVPYYDALQNGSFEEPGTDGEEKFVGSGTEEVVWKTTGYNENHGSRIELVGINTMDWHGVNYCPTDEVYAVSQQCAELNADSAGALYQDVLTMPGSTMYWSLMHSGRTRNGQSTYVGSNLNKDNPASDTMYVLIMSTELAEEYQINTQNDVEHVIQNLGDFPGASVTKISYQWYWTGNRFTGRTLHVYNDDTKEWDEYEYDVDFKTVWRNHQGTYVVPDDQYLTRYFFVAGETELGENSGDNVEPYSVGNHIDNVHFSTDVPPAADGTVTLEIVKNITGDLTNEDYTKLQKNLEFTVEYGTFEVTVKGSEMTWGGTTENHIGTYVISNIPVSANGEISYSVTEVATSAEVDGYTLTASAEGGEDLTVSGRLKDGDTGEAKFINAYESTGADLTIVKYIYGLTDEEVVKLINGDYRKMNSETADESGLRFDVDVFDEKNHLTSDEAGYDVPSDWGVTHPGSDDWNIRDWTFNVDNTLEKLDSDKWQNAFNNTERTWKGWISYDERVKPGDPSIAQEDMSHYQKSSLKKENGYYVYTVTIEDVDLSKWYRVRELHMNVPGYDLDASVETTGATTIFTETTNHDGRASAFRLTGDTTVTFTNWYEQDQLDLTKNVTVSGVTQNTGTTEFTFTLQIPNEWGNNPAKYNTGVYNVTYTREDDTSTTGVNESIQTHEDGTIQFNADGTYTDLKLYAGETAHIKLPADIQVTITETGYDGYAVNWTVGNGQTLVNNGEGSVTVTLPGGQNVTCTNTTGAVLPSTGGMGVVPYFTLGSLMTIGGGLLLIRRRWKGGHAAR